ncbi:MAG: hypothetical protein G01um101472_517 [Parcubacteria group bacterium Gr01-1014_72]|nr:MAG: hypothetical protein G01um101472_517 [Parcubacteria group bacterium Gr01-1014_72]
MVFNGVISFIRRHERALFSLAAVLLLALFVAEISVLTLYRETWVDEVFAPFKSYLVLRGELTPFVDGLFEYPPLYLATYAPVEILFGPSILAMRVFAGALFTCLMALLFIFVRRLAGKWYALLGVSLILANLLLSGNFVTATMYSLTALITFALVVLETTSISRGGKTALAALLSALLILSRTNMVVVLLAYLIFLFLVQVPLREYVRYFVLTALIVVAGYIPVVAYNPSLALAHILSPFTLSGPLSELPPSLKSGSLNIPRFLEVLTAFLREYGPYLLALGALLAALVAKEREKMREFFVRESTFSLAISLAGVLLVTHFFHPFIVGNVYYGNYFMHLVVFLSVVLAGRFLSEEKWPRYFLVGLLILVAATNLFRTDVVSSPREETDLERVTRGAAFLRERTKPDDLVLSFDNSIFHVYLADRRTTPPLINRDFHFLGDADTAKVKRIGFYNLAMLRSWVEEEADFLVVHKERSPLSFLRSPFWGEGSEDTEARLMEIQTVIENRYELVGEELNVYPRKYTKGNDGGTLLLYRKKE